MTAPLVSLQRCRTYREEEVEEALQHLLEPLGGMQAWIRPGQRVLLKPNLVMGSPPETATTTHPALIRAVAKEALRQGGIVAIGDSPGLGSGRSAAEKAGVMEVVRELGLSFVEFTPVRVTLEESSRSRPLESQTRLYRTLTLAREVLEADVVINLPKLKTHCQMLLTCAVKNLFGAVVGVEKFQWHYRAGEDREAFARMLYEIAATIRPALSIVDAIVAQDGHGPTSGTPNPTGFLAAGRDPSAVDAICLDILGIPRERLATLRAARSAGDYAWERAEWRGVDPAALRPDHWLFPETQSLAMGPRWLDRYPTLARWIRNQISPTPQILPERCTSCGACLRLCPAQAMHRKGEGEKGIRIDPDRCIRCYCCHELCPSHALTLRPSGLGYLLQLFFS